jgi:hypothetical protein
MLNRSKIAIVVDSFVRGQTFQVVKQESSPHRCHGSTIALIISSPTVDPRHAAPHRFQTETLLMPSVRHERTDAHRLR